MSYWKQTEIIDPFATISQLSPGGEITIAEPIRLAGDIFVGSSIDANFWTTTVTGTGSITEGGGQATLTTGATANSSALLESVSVARSLGETFNRYSGLAQLSDTGAANNIRRWGAEAGGVADGIYFALVGTVLNVGTMKGGVETLVPFSSWNQGIAAPTLTNSNIYRIVYTQQKAQFYINNVPAHMMLFTASTPMNTSNLKAFLQNVNSGGGTANVSIYSRSCSIQRLGTFESQPKFVRITTAGTYAGKLTAGVLHKLTVNNPGGSTATITMYDNTSASGLIIGVLNFPSAGNPGTLHYDIPFNIGLTIVSTGTWDATIIYQ